MAKSLLMTTRKKKPKARQTTLPGEPLWNEINPELDTYVNTKRYALGWISSDFSTKDLKDATIKYSKVNRKNQMKKFNYSSIDQTLFMTV